MKPLFTANEDKELLYTYIHEDYKKDKNWQKRTLNRANAICATMIVPAIGILCATLFSPFDKEISILVTVIVSELITIPFAFHSFRKDKAKYSTELSTRRNNKIVVEEKNYVPVIKYSYDEKVGKNVLHYESQTQLNFMEQIVLVPDRSVLAILCGGTDLQYLPNGNVLQCKSYQVGNNYSTSEPRWIEIPMIFKNNNDIINYLRRSDAPFEVQYGVESESES